MVTGAFNSRFTIALTLKVRIEQTVTNNLLRVKEVIVAVNKMDLVGLFGRSL
jgi:sulfate adenylyltransferase subunit 1 (EFTu-like GTPase family)